jgi:CMP-N-acetylneuraminic acid synthetase
MFEIDRLEAIDIDEELDFKLAEILHQEINQNLE